MARINVWIMVRWARRVPSPGLHTWDKGRAVVSKRSVAKLVVRGILAILGLTVAVLQAFDQTKIVHLSRWWELSALIGVGAITFLDNTWAVVRASTDARRAEARRKVFRAVTTALSVIAETNATSIMHLGASVFLIKKRFVWSGWQRAGFRCEQVLVRWDRIRLSGHPQPTKVRWTVGKGAVGTAWEKGRAAHRSWQAINTKWAAGTPTRDQFDRRVSAEAKCGLSYEEFVSLLGKYSETLAVPIMNENGNVYGILSVDVACTGGVPEILKDRDVEKLIENTVESMRPELSK